MPADLGLPSGQKGASMPENHLSHSQCAWCRTEIGESRNRGSRKRFCCPEHRYAYWAAARRWVAEAIEAGLLSVADLKAAERKNAPLRQCGGRAALPSRQGTMAIAEACTPTQRRCYDGGPASSRG